jgi:hypothetical protein
VLILSLLAVIKYVVGVDTRSKNQGKGGGGRLAAWAGTGQLIGGMGLVEQNLLLCLERVTTPKEEISHHIGHPQFVCRIHCENCKFFCVQVKNKP